MTITSCCVGGWLLPAAGSTVMIYGQPGLLGVSGGISSDMRTLRASDAPEASEAIALFVHRIVRETGSLAAAMGGIDGIVFTAGIGENDAATRLEVMRGCWSPRSRSTLMTC